VEAIRQELDNLAKRYFDLTDLISQLEEERSRVAQEILNIWQKTQLKPSRWATVVAGRTSYDQDRLIAYLKARGLRQAIKTQEVLDRKALKQLMDSGQLSEQELEQFKTTGRPYVQLVKPKEE